MANRRSTRINSDSAAEVCRTCMDGMNPVGRAKRNRKMGPRVPIFARVEDAFIANVITDCTGVEITENDGLPAVICTECFKTVALLVTFIQSTRDCDAKLRQLCKVEILEEEEEPTQKGDGEGGGPSEQTEVTDATHFLEIKCESVEETMGDETVEDVALESDEAEPDNDTDSDWKGNGDDEEEDEEERKVKRQRLGLKSKPKPRRVGGNTKDKRKRAPRIPRIPTQSADDLKLNKKEQELFTTFKVPPDSHVCCGCLQIYNSPEELETHRKLTHVWKSHERVKEMPNKLVCDGCLRRYSSKKKLNYHLDRIRLLKAVWECNKCKKRFKMAVKRQQHAKLHPDDAPVARIARIMEATVKELGWPCCGWKCSASYSTEKELIAHGLEAHWMRKQKADLEAAEKPEQCQICFARFATLKKVEHHQRRAYRPSNFQCSLCGLKFVCRSELNRHETREHGMSSLFQCQICGKKFSYKNCLTSHMDNIHSDVKPHQCTVCGMTFKQRGNLKAHMSSHIEVPQFKCEVCSKMYKGEKQLRQHMRTHTGEKPYKCRICGHAFANHTNCRRHEMTHSGDRPHKCSYCEKSFILRRTLLEHESTHTGLKSTRPKVVRSKSKPQQNSEVDKLMEVVEVDDDDDDNVDEPSSNDTSCNQPLSMAGNRPVAMSAAMPTVSSQAWNTFQQSFPHLAAAPSNAGIQSATVSTVYNAMPSTPGNAYQYIWKF